MGTIVSVQKDFDAEEEDWNFGETMAHSGHLRPPLGEKHLLSKHHSSDDQNGMKTTLTFGPATYKIRNVRKGDIHSARSRPGRRTSLAGNEMAESQCVRTVNVAPAYVRDREDVSATLQEEEMDTLTVQSSMLLSCESIASSLEQCPESTTALVKAQPVVKDGTPKKLQKPILINGRSLSPAPPSMDTEVSRKRSISGESARKRSISGESTLNVTERQKSNKSIERYVRTPTATLRANVAERTDNTLHVGVDDFARPRSRIATPSAAKEKIKSLPRESNASPFLKESKKLPPIKVPLQPSLMKFGSDDIAGILPQLKPSQPLPNFNTPRHEKVNVLITNERDEAIPIVERLACSTELNKGVTHANPADSHSSMTKLLFEEIADRSILSDTISIEDSATKDSGIEEGAEEEGGVKGEAAKVWQHADHTVKDGKQEASITVPSKSVFFPPDEEFIRKAAKLRGEGTIAKLKNLTPSVRRDYDNFMVDIENVAFYAKQQAEATLGDYTPQKVLLISSRVPNCDSLKAAVRPDVLCQIYDFETETLKGIVEIMKTLLNGYKMGAKAKYLGIVCKGGPGFMYLLTKTPVTPAKLKQNGDMILFWKCIGVLMSKLIPRESVIYLMESNVAGNAQGEKLLLDMETLLFSNQVRVQAPLEMSPQGREMIALYFDLVMHRQWKSTRYPKLQLYIK